MASITPDPKKRGYLLPPGCKDLIDLLQPRRRGKQQLLKASSKIKLSNSGRGQGGLSDIGKYVALVFESRALSFTLAIFPPGEHVSVDVSRHEDGEVGAHLFVQMNTPEETATRDFFRRHNLPLPLPSEMPSLFIPGVPIHDKFTISPMPPDAVQLTAFLADLLREVCRPTGPSPLHFSYHETAKVL